MIPYIGLLFYEEKTDKRREIKQYPRSKMYDERSMGVCTGFLNRFEFSELKLTDDHVTRKDSCHTLSGLISVLVRVSVCVP